MQRWQVLCDSAGARGPVSATYEELLRRYAEPVRAYHNGHHIAECLEEFADVRELASQPLSVEFAIWYHDAVYDPRAADNEERSADLARDFLAALGLPQEDAEVVVRLVMATKHHDGSLHPDAPLLVDIDLSILGREEARFWEYERQIRQEYQWVPEAVFTIKRAEILERFLARPFLYGTEYFRAKYEAQARKNLAASVARLWDGTA